MGGAGSSGDPLNVENVFSTHLYTGNGNSNLGIVNNIDLSGEGGMVWYRRRDNPENNSIEDTVRGLDNAIYTDSQNAQADPGPYGLQAFNSDGFTAGYDTNAKPYVTWTFRKATKFFDIVTWTGNQTARTISHNLGSVPGMIMVKNVSAGGTDWRVWHRSLTSDAYMLLLNATNAEINSGNGSWNSTAPTSSVFTVGGDFDVNRNNDTHVAYLFAHNDDDGGFGLGSDQDIIKCGTYTGDGGAGTTEVNLGFEPQWILVRAISAADNWYVIDNMRGWATHNNTSNDAYLFPNATNAEATGGVLDITSTGFKTTLYTNANVNNREYIYMAIRRGPMAVPVNASDVFAVDLSPNSNNPRFISGFPIDMAMQRRRSSDGVEGMDITSRLSQDTFLRTGSTNGDNSTSTMDFDFMNGFDDDGDSADNFIAQMWKRAPTFFDVVCYTGTGSARTVTHNLEAIPEMIWVKNRDQTVAWSVYHTSLGNTKQVSLNASTTPATSSSYWNNTTPTSSVFTVGTAGSTNSNTRRYIAFLFTTLAGISKCGTYTGNGSNQNIDCGFSNGAKLIILKDVSSAQDWYIFDAERGIVSGNDPALRLNVEHAEITNADAVDPYSGGFNVVQNGNAETNANGNTYIFYAVAA